MEMINNSRWIGSIRVILNLVHFEWNAFFEEVRGFYLTAFCFSSCF